MWDEHKDPPCQDTTGRAFATSPMVGGPDEGLFNTRRRCRDSPSAISDLLLKPFIASLPAAPHPTPPLPSTSCNWIGNAAQRRVAKQDGRQLIMSLLLTPYVEFFIESFTSLRNTERFCVNLSLFFVNRFRSIPSIKFSKQRCMACCFSGGWLFTMLFLRSAKYFSFKRINPSRGRDMDH